MIARVTAQSIVGIYPIVRHCAKSGIGITIDLDAEDIKRAILSFSETMSEFQFREILDAVERELELEESK